MGASFPSQLPTLTFTPSRSSALPLPPPSAGAIRAYCAGSLFDRARQLAGSNPTFNTYIDEQHNSHLVQHKAVDEMVVRGGAMTQQAIDMYVQRDEWDKVRAQREGGGQQMASELGRGRQTGHAGPPPNMPHRLVCQSYHPFTPLALPTNSTT